MIGTIVVGIILACVVGLAVRSIVKDKKNGKSCGCDCGHCKGCH